MPLYIDYHQLEGNLTIEDVRAAHQADLANQDQYGVRYIQLWVNKKAAMVFCLIEGPDPESCIACHLASHGNTPCNIQEVEEGLLKLYLGENLLTDEYDMTLTKEGLLDSANRTIMAIDFLLPYIAIKDNMYASIAKKLKIIVASLISQFDGRIITSPFHNQITAVFNSSLNTLRCAKRIQEELTKRNHKNAVFRMAINNHQPLAETKGFFEGAVLLANWMCAIAGNKQLVLSNGVKDVYELEADRLLFPFSIKVLSKPEESFIKKIFNHLENGLDQGALNVNILCSQIGMSRTQMYRKIISLTGRSVNKLINEIRMRRAWILLGNKERNISEIAFEVGFSSPSYFSKQFRRSFGYPPSELHKYCG